MKVVRSVIDGKEMYVILNKRRCSFCNDLFQPLRRHTKFCSQSCWRRSSYRKNHSKEMAYKDKIRHGSKKQELIDKHGLKCVKCGKEGDSFEIVAHHKTFNNQEHDHQELVCRACHARIHHSVEKKPLSKEQIERAINETKNLFEACEVLGINRSSLYEKRKKLGIL